MKKALTIFFVVSVSIAFSFLILPWRKLLTTDRTLLITDARPPIEHIIEKAGFSVKTFAAWDACSLVHEENRAGAAAFTVTIYQKNGGKNEYPLTVTIKPAPDAPGDFSPGQSFMFIPDKTLLEQALPQLERSFKAAGRISVSANILATPAAKFIFLRAINGSAGAFYAATTEKGLQYIFSHDVPESAGFSQEEIKILGGNFRSALESFRLL